MKSSKPDRKFCDKQIERFMVYETSFPKQLAGVRVLSEALMKHAKSEDHARRTVDQILETSEFCPMPGVIREVAESLPITSPAPAACSQCGGREWVHVVISGYDSERRCDCALGRHYAAADAERAGTVGR